jgi:hypothetical protein
MRLNPEPDNLFPMNKNSIGVRLNRFIGYSTLKFIARKIDVLANHHLIKAE